VAGRTLRLVFDLAKSLVIDLLLMSEGSGPVAIVTGSSTGIGYHTALRLALRGYTVVIATRNTISGAQAVERINKAVHSASLNENKGFLDGGNVHKGGAVFRHLDLSSLASVRTFSEGLPATLSERLHALVLNAGIAGFGIRREDRITSDDLELIFATNFVGHFYLVQLLLESLKLTASRAFVGAPPVRIVTLSSVTHRLVPSTAIDWNAVLTGRVRGYAYQYSKLAALLFAGELQRQLLGTGVSAVAVNPGAVNSEIWRNLPVPSFVACYTVPVLRCFGLTPAQGCETSVVATTADEVGGVRLESPGTTVYLSPYASPGWAQRLGGVLATLFDTLGPFRGAQVMAPTAQSLDPDVARALFVACETAIARKMGL